MPAACTAKCALLQPSHLLTVVGGWRPISWTQQVWRASSAFSFRLLCIHCVDSLWTVGKAMHITHLSHANSRPGSKASDPARAQQFLSTLATDCADVYDPRNSHILFMDEIGAANASLAYNFEQRVSLIVMELTLVVLSFYTAVVTATNSATLRNLVSVRRSRPYRPIFQRDPQPPCAGAVTIDDSLATAVIL